MNPTYALWASKQQVAVAAGNTTEAQTTVDSEASRSPAISLSATSPNVKAP